MCAEVSTVLRAVAADFFFNCWYLEFPSDNRIQHIPRWFTVMRKAFDCKCYTRAFEPKTSLYWYKVPFQSILVKVLFQSILGKVLFQSILGQGAVSVYIGTRCRFSLYWHKVPFHSILVKVPF
jgi:hypothetical protein